MKTQNQEILEHLKSGKSITDVYAFTRFRCRRLAARICDLRRDGFNIVTTMKKKRSGRTGRPVQYAVYKLEVMP